MKMREMNNISPSSLPLRQLLPLIHLQNTKLFKVQNTKLEFTNLQNTIPRWNLKKVGEEVDECLHFLCASSSLLSYISSSIYKIQNYLGGYNTKYQIQNTHLERHLNLITCWLLCSLVAVLSLVFPLVLSLVFSWVSPYTFTFLRNFCLSVVIVCLLCELCPLRELPWVALITLKWFGARIW